MARILLTAFEPYGPWQENSSWLTMIALTRQLPEYPQLVTRRYPVDFAKVKAQLERDLAAGYDFALHLGQAPGSTHIRLEAVGLNIGRERPAGEPFALAAGRPLAYQSLLPLDVWAERLARLEIPAEVSFHAGTYLCNAAMYWTHEFIDRHKLATKAAFVHLPLTTSQAASRLEPLPSLPTEMLSAGVRELVVALGQLDAPPDAVA